MKSLLEKYRRKLTGQGLADTSDALLLALDDEIYAVAGAGLQDPGCKGIQESLREVFRLMNINSLLFAFPGAPYGTILREILRHEPGAASIIPEDCETRTFFHDIPVVSSTEPGVIAAALSRRKSAVISMDGSGPPAVVSYGTVSPEQAFVSFSSTCFSTFVKYFYDYRMHCEACSKEGRGPEAQRVAGFNAVSEALKDYYAAVPRDSRPLMTGPPRSEDAVLAMLDEAGKRLVAGRLVDSFFGNISLFSDDMIHISETASSLDELTSAVDAVPLDGSSSVGITSSSEYAAHRAVYQTTGARCILHGHPKFAVILSMICLKDCELRGTCHRACREKRDLFGVPVVPGEIGTGPTGIVNTVPGALAGSDAVVVHGHGVFTTGHADFNRPFTRMREIESACREEYFRRAGSFCE